MEFSGQYLTYEEYLALGGTLDLMPFNLLEFEARKKIDGRTLNKIKDNIPNEVKLCEYNLINSINSYVIANQNKNIKSESIDGYSVNYGEISNVIQSKNDEFNDIIDTYLFGVFVDGEHLIYSGVDR